MAVVHVHSDEDFESQLASTTQLVVVYFNVAINAGCRIVTPKYATFPAKYPQALFLSVNTEECGKMNVCTAVSQIPHFRVYKNKERIQNAEFTGNNITKIQELIEKNL